MSPRPTRAIPCSPACHPTVGRRSSPSRTGRAATASTSGCRGRARPCSSRCEPVFEAIYERGRVAEQLSDRAWQRALLDVEAALARALGRLGQIPDGAAQQIAAACRELRHSPSLAATLERSSAEHATPVIGLVAALRDAVGEAAREHVHQGATSQDILDTALMLLLRRALDPLLD